MAAWGLVSVSAFPVPFILSALPRGSATALLWNVTKSLMRRDLDSEVVEGTNEGPLLLQPLPLCHVLGQPSHGETSPGCGPTCFSLLCPLLCEFLLFKIQLWSTLWSSGFTE